MNTSEASHTAPAEDPREQHAQPPFPEQRQDPPGVETEMRPRPDHGEHSYRGYGRLQGRRALVTGGDSGIGKAVAIAFAREGADVAITYLPQEAEDARDAAHWIRDAGRSAVLIETDLSEEANCQAAVQRAVQELGGLDILVNNAAHQQLFDRLEDITTDEWEYTFRVNLFAMFHLSKAAVPHMPPGSTIINTASIQSVRPSPKLLAYATTKGAIANFTEGLSLMLLERGIRVNAVAPGPVWTPLIVISFPPEQAAKFGSDNPMQRPAQPAELAPMYVVLASPESSYVNGAVFPVTGGKPML